MVELDKGTFLRRITALYDHWTVDSNGLSTIDAIAVPSASNEDTYTKTNTFQRWLYGVEVTDCVALLTKKGIYFLASNRKADFFKPAASTSSQGSVPPIHIIYRNKADKDAANFAKLMDHIKEDASSKIGVFLKDKLSSEFVKSWEAALTEAEIEKVDISGRIASIFCTHDSKAQELVKMSGQVAVNAWNFAKKKIIDVVDQEKKVKAASFAKLVEDKLSSQEVQGHFAKKKDAIETAYDPIVQSGGSYSFKWSTASSEKQVLHFGCIMTNIGIRFDSYCANVGRTVFVNVSDNVQKAYDVILAAEQVLIEKLKPGAKVGDAYAACISYIKNADASVYEKLNKKELGFATGVEFREKTILIAPDNETEVKAGMAFVLYLGVNDLRNKNAKEDPDKNVAIGISDTVLVKEDGPNEILTAGAKSKTGSVFMRIKEDEDEDEPSSSKNNGSDKENGKDLGRGKRSVVLTDVTRNKTTNEEKRKERQKELAEKMNAEAEARLANQSGSKDVKKSKRSNVSYKSYEKFPQDDEIAKLSIHVDKRHDTVILPVFGVPVPFHISTFKNCSQSVEGDFTYLRINFMHPGSQIGKEQSQFPNPLANYLKELTFRASNIKEHGQANAPSFNLSNSFRLIKELQKRFRTEEAEEREKEGAVKQDKLVLSTGKANPKLKDLLVRPNIIAKRVSGSLEAHINGFRYTSVRGDRIDVLYNNIKHALFQPCDNEMIILVHFHLKNAVLYGKKKYKDVQFYSEVGEITTDLGKYHHMQDRDDVQSEQMERDMRRKLNMAFQNFCDKVERQTNQMVEFEAPFPQLGFLGVPHRSSCTLKPTSSCLVNLTEWPPFIVALEEVELIHFERVSFSLKNFDMVFIFKDYNRKTQMVQQIPMSSLDNVKDWLNSCDIRYTEGIQSLNWAKIMKTITDDPTDFFSQGGWNFLCSDSDDEADEDEEESSEGYSPDEDGVSGEDESDEDESEGSGVSETESETEESLGSDESEGKDWSDLEEEAKKADNRRDEEERSVPVSSASASRHRHHHSKHSGGGGGDRHKDRHRDRHHHSSSGRHGDDRKRKSSGGKSSHQAPPHKRRK